MSPRRIEWASWPYGQEVFNTLQTNLSTSAVIDLPVIPDARVAIVEVLSGSIRYGLTNQVTLPVFGHIAHAGDIIIIEGVFRMSKFRMVPLGPTPSTIYGPASVHMTFLK